MQWINILGLITQLFNDGEIFHNDIFFSEHAGQCPKKEQDCSAQEDFSVRNPYLNHSNKEK